MNKMILILSTEVTIGTIGTFTQTMDEMWLFMVGLMIGFILFRVCQILKEG